VYVNEQCDVIGGPALGDIRSRLIRLIPDAPEGSPLRAIKHLLEYRLSGDKPSNEVKAEWLSIVEGKHRLWKVSPPFPPRPTNPCSGH